MGRHRSQRRHALQIGRGQLALLLDQPQEDGVRAPLQGILRDVSGESSRRDIITRSGGSKADDMGETVVVADHG
jgi:hypothetical protein